MKEVYTIMSAMLGVPPLPGADGKGEKFVWDFYDKDGKPGRWEGTPQEFFVIAKGDHEPKDSFSLIHDPRNDFGKLYTVDKLGNLWGGRPVLCAPFICLWRPAWLTSECRREHQDRRPQAGHCQDDQGWPARLLWL